MDIGWSVKIDRQFYFRRDSRKLIWRKNKDHKITTHHQKDVWSFMMCVPNGNKSKHLISSKQTKRKKNETAQFLHEIHTIANHSVYMCNSIPRLHCVEWRDRNHFRYVVRFIYTGTCCVYIMRVYWSNRIIWKPIST